MEKVLLNRIWLRNNEFVKYILITLVYLELCVILCVCFRHEQEHTGRDGQVGRRLREAAGAPEPETEDQTHRQDQGGEQHSQSGQYAKTQT